MLFYYAFYDEWYYAMDSSVNNVKKWDFIRVDREGVYLLRFSWRQEHIILVTIHFIMMWWVGCTGGGWTGRKVFKGKRVGFA